LRQKGLYFGRIGRAFFAGIGGDAGFDTAAIFGIVNLFARSADELKAGI